MISYIIITSLFTLGLRVACKKGMILEKFYSLSELYLPTIIFMPLIGCIYCMASVWSIVVHTLLYMSGFYTSIFIVLICIPCVASLNYMIVQLFPLIDEIE